MRGKLNLTVQTNPKEKSVMGDMSYKSPIKLMKPFYLDNLGTAFIYIMDVSGGMLEDDEIDYQVFVKESAHLYLTNTSATKIHPMTNPNKYAIINNYFSVAEKGSLEYFPEEMILFENANVQNNTQVEIHSNSVLAFSEITLMGRKHYGEMFKFNQMKSNLEIFIDGKITVWDRFELSPHKEQVHALGYMEQNSHYGTLYLFSPNMDKALLEIVRGVIHEIEKEEIQIGCSLHTSGIMVIKALAPNHYLIKEAFRAIWSEIRPQTMKEVLPYIHK